MENTSQQLKLTGKVIIRSYPAGTLHLYETLVGLGKLGLARGLLDDGKIEVKQHNMVVWSLGLGFDALVQFLVSAYNGNFSLTNGTTLTGTTDGTTGIITGISSTAGLTAGMAISGIGVAPYSTIISINSSTSVTISQSTTAAGTVPLIFTTIQQLGIQWGEIGTGNTAPANTDTALTAPTNRASVSYAVDSGYNEAQLQFFFPDASLANATYYEFGTFIGGSSAIGSGNLFNHALFSVPYSKSAGTDTTVEVDLTFSN
jgi:hypothetical protein